MLKKVCLTIVAAAVVLAAETIPESLRGALIFHASFDRGADADLAKGDRRIYSAPSYKEQEKAVPGIASPDIEIARGAGLAGDALRFTKKNTRALFYKADGNMAYRKSGWSGTVSFWLRLNPDEDLAPGFCDPIQVTDDAYNDSAMWVDFTKDDRPRHFRLGVFGDLKSWNPKGLAENPDFDKRLVVVRKPPFTRSRWTHVAITWSQLNGEQGSASLYLNGESAGTARSIKEPFTWDLSKAAIRVGVNYVGLFDELAVFDRALGPDEIGELHREGR